ncbi:probable disease resistance protein At5g63020 [Cornus florida]|uniref:probable disease resistance protein At5g63020 n=1 Tax=Cornus florida TaxID=4283 RepID=UPI00289A62D3|nr:probable disease resistance protein At5g63020 [Cornus florida]XP_059634659.1 probable disease resistance protein At5g63020 [Cornus florida]
MELVSPILDVACRLCGCIGNSTNNICHLQKNLTTLRTEMEKLKRQRDDMRQEVETAERQPMGQRSSRADLWLQSVEELEREVDQILQKGEEQIQRRCFKVCPRNCWSTNKIGKEVWGKLQAVSQAINEGTNIPVAVTSAPPHAQEMPLNRTVGLDSKLNEVLGLLTDDGGPGIIGIYGMAGVGKTTLLTKLNNELTKQVISGGFDEVIWVVVSKDQSSVESVQDKMGKKLGFPETWSRDNTQDEKKGEIFRVLRMKRFVLLLDDIWSPIDLVEVGIPLLPADNQPKSSKVVFTTRFMNVCGVMEAKKTIEVECLAWQAAWDLFKDKVGEETLNSHPAIGKLAEDVCKECARLPLVLITIGRAMAAKTTPQEWNYALNVLKNSTFKISGMENEVFRRLKFSYDNLCDETTRICFLYCALYPEDWDINVSDLIEFWIGEGFFDNECDNIDEACELGYEIIGRLKHACLLLKKEYVYCVNMHDVIRDMALSIVNSESGKEIKYFVQGNLNLTTAPPISKWEKAERVFLLENSIEELSETPKCPNLLTLNLAENHLRTISDTFFQFMHALKVLDLSGNDDLTKLPASFFGLPSLQHLNLTRTGIRQLPIEFKSLVTLKYLYLGVRWETDDIIIPPQVISSLLILQRLEFGSRSVLLEGIDEGSNFKLFLDELESLNHLQYLTLTVKTEVALHNLSSWRKLGSCIAGLTIKECEGSSSLQLSSLQKNAKRLEWLTIVDCSDLEELSMRQDHIIIDAASRSFHNLRNVTIDACRVLRDLTCLIWVPKLQNLYIYGCVAMEQVIKDADCSADDIGGEGSSNVFRELQTLGLWNLPELKSICSHPLPFPSLFKVAVGNCPKLNKLPFDSNSGKGTLQSITCERNLWDKLEWENEETQSVFSPLFKPW